MSQNPYVLTPLKTSPPPPRSLHWTTPQALFLLQMKANKMENKPQLSLCEQTREADIGKRHINAALAFVLAMIVPNQGHPVGPQSSSILKL